MILCTQVGSGNRYEVWEDMELLFGDRTGFEWNPVAAGVAGERDGRSLLADDRSRTDVHVRIQELAFVAASRRVGMESRVAGYSASVGGHDVLSGAKPASMVADVRDGRNGLRPRGGGSDRGSVGGSRAAMRNERLVFEVPEGD